MEEIDEEDWSKWMREKNQVDPNIPTLAILNQRAVSVPLWV